MWPLQGCSTRCLDQDTSLHSAWEWKVWLRLPFSPEKTWPSSTKALRLENLTIATSSEKNSDHTPQFYCLAILAMPTEQKKQGTLQEYRVHDLATSTTRYESPGSCCQVTIVNKAGNDDERIYNFVFFLAVSSFQLREFGYMPASYVCLHMSVNSSLSKNWQSQERSLRPICNACKHHSSSQDTRVKGDGGLGTYLHIIGSPNWQKPAVVLYK